MQIKLTAKQIDVYWGKICGYCNSKTKIVTEEFVYGRKYKGRLIACCINFPECDSYVSCDDDGIPLGRVANRLVRQYRKQAHAAFDRIWMQKYTERTQLYEYLADYLEIPDDHCHISHMNIKNLKKTIEWSNDRWKEIHQP